MSCTSQAPGGTDAASPEMYQSRFTERGLAIRMNNSAWFAPMGNILEGSEEEAVGQSILSSERWGYRCNLSRSLSFDPALPFPSALRPVLQALSIAKKDCCQIASSHSKCPLCYALPINLAFVPGVLRVSPSLPDQLWLRGAGTLRPQFRDAG